RMDQPPAGSLVASAARPCEPVTFRECLALSISPDSDAITALSAHQTGDAAAAPCLRSVLVVGLDVEPHRQQVAHEEGPQRPVADADTARLPVNDVAQRDAVVLSSPDP